MGKLRESGPELPESVQKGRPGRQRMWDHAAAECVLRETDQKTPGQLGSSRGCEALEMIVHASAGDGNSHGCPSRLGVCRTHAAKAAHRCSNVGNKREKAALSQISCKRCRSCTFVHASLLRNWGRTGPSKAPLSLLRPRTCAAHSETRGRAILSSKVDALQNT